MDFDGPYGPGMGGWFGHALKAAFGGLFAMFLLLVLAGLIFLLVRYLLVATKAAQIYVAKNTPTGPPATSATPATRPTTTNATTKPAPRTPKTPPKS